MPYKADDYSAVSLSARAPGVLCTRTDFPAKNAREFLDVLKKSPGKYTYGNDGVGGTTHLAAERIFAAAGVEARAIPFAGANENINSLLGGNTDIYAASMAPALPFVKQGSVKCLLLTSAERNEALPDVESLSDIGLSHVASYVWRGIIAPAGVPEDRLKKLIDVFQKAAKDPKFVKMSATRGEEAQGSDAATFQKLIDEESAAFGKVVNTLGLAKSK